MERKELEKILGSHTKWLRGEDGVRADLQYADLQYADLRDADLRGADFRDSDLMDADLSGAKNVNIPFACPSDGAFVGWKKCRDNLIVKLQVQSSAKRLSATGRKCRCDKAKVLAIQNMDGTTANVDFAVSFRNISFVYRVGSYVSVANFDECRWNECSSGIHFFITRDEAVQYEV